MNLNAFMVHLGQSENACTGCTALVRVIYFLHAGVNHFT